MLYFYKLACRRHRPRYIKKSELRNWIKLSRQPLDNFQLKRVSFLICFICSIAAISYSNCRQQNSARYNSVHNLSSVENTSFLERLPCILHSHVCEMYQGYKSNFGFHFFFSTSKSGKSGIENPFWIRRKEHTLRFASSCCPQPIASCTGNANDRTSSSLAR